MRTFTQLTTLATTLSNNNSAGNTTLMGQLINDGHRYLIQKYFDNERTVTTTTVGAQSLVLTGSLAIGAKSATLTATWAYPTNYQLVNFSSGEQRNVLFTNGSAAISWADGLNSTATTAIKTVGVQYYTIPANVSKVKNETLNIGQLKFQPRFIQSRQEWDDVNFLPYTSDIPQYVFIYNGQMGIWPIPSTTGNIMTFNYKTRVADLSFSDVTDGHIDSAGMVVGSTAVTGTGTSWSATDKFPTGVDVSYYNLQLNAAPPNGDGIWYPISQFASDTALTLQVPVINAPNITSSTNYTIGQMPLLSEDFHDMLVYYALTVYFTSVVDNPEKFKMYQSLYQQKLQLLEDYAGTKQVNVDLGAEPNPTNPNLFIYSS